MFGRRTRHLSLSLPFSTDVLKQLNQRVDPCTDFYEYACGGWEDENALGPGETSVTGFSLVKEKSYNVLRDALSNATKTYSDVSRTLSPILLQPVLQPVNARQTQNRYSKFEFSQKTRARVVAVDHGQLFPPR